MTGATGGERVRVVLQRVRHAAVGVATGGGTEVVGEVGRGLLALVGVGRDSSQEDAAWLAAKTAALRLFPPERVDAATGGDKMERSVVEVGGGVLAVSQFTLYGDARKGRRPSFVRAAEPGHGRALYEAYCAALPVSTATGVFGAHMRITAELDGPVTLTLERTAGRTA